MQCAVTGKPAVCCMKAVMTALPSGGNGRLDCAIILSHSASISSYVDSMTANDPIAQRPGPRDATIATATRWRCSAWLGHTSILTVLIIWSRVVWRETAATPSL